MRSLLKALGLVLALAGVASAQIAGGNVYGTVTDQQGAVMPGVSVTLVGETGTRSATSGTDGTFRFLGVERGDYTLTVSISGFASAVRKIRVTTGENVELAFSLKVSSVAETVEVTGETPLVDTKRRGTSTTMTAEELKQVPNARDPWAVLQAVPGVLVDRVNIAGSENGQQANNSGKGSATADRMWNLDGIVITDMSATGASPTYFDFDAFQEIAVTTGGSDLTAQSGGIGINLTTKRGTNSFHGGGRFMLAHDDVSFSNLPSSLDNDPRLVNADGSRRDKADHIQQITDYGFDLGGPILKDKLWFYGTYGKQDIRLVRLNGTPDKTLLPSYNFKLNWQPGAQTMVSAFYFTGNKQKFGRDPGVGVIPTDSFAWDQANEAYEGGLPSGLWKLQVDQTFSSNFFMSFKAAYYDNGFSLSPRGGTDDTWTVDYFNNEGLGSFAKYLAIRPQKNLTVDGNYFFEGLGGSNELKFGFSWRDYKTISGYALGGSELVGYLQTADSGEVEIGRTQPEKEYVGRYWSAYVGDVLSKDRFTFNFGVRWDLQTAKNSPATVPANKAFPEIMPALEYPGDAGNVIEWNSFSPRVGMSYALNESRRTVLRASYALYGGQLSFGDVNDINPVSWGAKAYGWNDTNGDRFVQPGEIDFAGGILYSYGVDLNNPSSAVSVNRIDKDYKPQKDHEVVVGIDHELGASFAVGAAYTWRRSSDFAYTPRLGGPCPADNSTLATCRVIQPEEYTQNAPSTVNGYTAYTYSPPAALVSAGGAGRIRTNAPGYTRTFSGFELTLTKRLANRWMSRVAFSWNDWSEDWDGMPYSLDLDDGNPTSTENDPLKPGGPVSILSGASGKTAFYTAINWQVYANALWQGPWGLDLSGAFIARQGGAYPISLRLGAGNDGTNTPLATSAIDSLRYDTLWNADLRLARMFKIGGSASMTLSAEWFNVFNNGTVLARARNANTAAFVDAAGGAETGIGRIEEIMAPSIFRFGARLSF
jgi:hypothetical protein